MSTFPHSILKSILKYVKVSVLLTLVKGTENRSSSNSYNKNIR